MFRQISFRLTSGLKLAGTFIFISGFAQLIFEFPALLVDGAHISTNTTSKPVHINISSKSNKKNSTSKLQTTTSDPFTGVNESTLWPPITCHEYYDRKKQKTFVQDNIMCEDGSHYRKELLKFKIQESQGCILWRMNVFVYNVTTDKFQYHAKDAGGLRKTLMTIFGSLGMMKRKSEDNKKRKAFVNKLVHKAVPCRGILNDIANREKLPSKYWLPFYHCVKHAWQCQKKKGSSGVGHHSNKKKHQHPG